MLVLPPELIDKIVERVGKKDILTLALVNHALHLHCSRRIYRFVVITSPASLMQFCRAVVSRKTHAPHVRNLSIRFKISGRVSLLRAFGNQVRAATRLLQNLVALDLRVAVGSSEILNLVELLSSAQFPALEDCRIHASVSQWPALVAFLNRHETLKGLITNVFHASDALQPKTLDPGTISLPNLLRVTAPITFACGITAGPHLTKICLIWPDVNDDTQANSHLAMLSKALPSISSLEFIVASWTITCIVQPAAEYFSRVSNIAFAVSADNDHVGQWEDFATAFENVVPSFTRLESLALYVPCAKDRLAFTMEVLEEEAALVRRWADLSPNGTLRSILLRSGRPWVLGADTPGEWAPSALRDLVTELKVDMSETTLSQSSMVMVKWVLRQALAARAAKREYSWYVRLLEVIFDSSWVDAVAPFMSAGDIPDFKLIPSTNRGAGAMYKFQIVFV
uniref:F-box domain-containing protein n=1 Tax=Mycena chlorophos TaxID=658473 RepID=A0ABQ0M5Y7_MYCCL|nr:predicted protein [Mycena chlorophos]